MAVQQQLNLRKYLIEPDPLIVLYDSPHGNQILAKYRIGRHHMEPVTIITVTHDARKFVELCIKATHRRTPEAHKHVIIDNGSTDGTLEMLREYNNARMIELYERRWPKNAGGHAKSLNWYLYSMPIDTNLVCLLDSDAYPVASGWLTHLVTHMQTLEADGTGFAHFRDESLLHPSCMLFKLDKLNHAGKPNWRINRMGGVFNDTGMTVCKAMIRYGAKLAPLSREVMDTICKHRWCGTRIEIAKNGVLDGHLPRLEYDKISAEWFSEDSARLDD